MLGAIQAVSPVMMSASAAVAAPGVQNAGGAQPFANLLTDTIGSVNQLEAQARQAEIGLMTGTGIDVHQAVIAAEKASMSFEMVLAVRNKAVQAYQSVIGMQF